ncbi:MAG: cytochrome P450 [Gammaproteobacteria bacterium]|nr:cytochrome P450 [Gammaproteobacteria bacterium]
MNRLGLTHTLRIPGLLRHLLHGRLGQAFAALYRAKGPQFLFQAPFSRRPLLVLMGVDSNLWAAEHSDRYLRPLFSRAQQVGERRAPMNEAMLNEALAPVRAAAHLADNLETLLATSYNVMSEWQVGDVLNAGEVCQRLAERQLCTLGLGVESLGCMSEFVALQRRDLLTDGLGLLPKSVRRSPFIERKRRRIDRALKKCVFGAGDDPAKWIAALLQANADHPHLLPLIDLPPHLEEVLMAAKRLGDLLAMCLCTLASHPDLHERVKQEADAIFSSPAPAPSALASEQVDITRRVYFETLRLFPPVPFVLREVMNPVSIGGRDLSVGARVLTAQCTPHYLEEEFKDPATFDIDRFTADRAEHLRPGAFAPFGLGSHACPASNQSELYVLANLLALVHYFNFQVTPSSYTLRLKMLPTSAPDNRLRIVITRKRNSLPS